MELLILIGILFLFLIVIILYKSQQSKQFSPSPDSISSPSINSSSGPSSRFNQEITCPRGAVCNKDVLPMPGDPNFPDLAKVPLDERGFSGDCYLFPGICPKGIYCQLDDRIRWARSEQPTRGRCVRYQQECFSCAPTAEDYLLDRENLPAFNGKTITPTGELTERTVTCDPNLICTGDTIPDLPSTCVQRRPPDRRNPPTRDELIQWSLRFVRLGGRSSKNIESLPCANHKDGICTRYKNVKTSPFTKGSSREDMIKTANHILKVLWPKKFGSFPGPFIPGVTDKDILLCGDPKYIEKLTDYQKNSGMEDYRVPVQSIELNEKEGWKNAPPCLFDYDFAYNDEGPSIWCLLHTITANLPDIISEEQRNVLKTIPSFLQQYLSCGTCRGNIRAHLFRIKMPETYFRNDWFHYFWRAHNYVNTQTAHTRCGTNTSCGLPWAIESDICAGKYLYPWFLPFADAVKQWTIPG